MIEMDEIRLIYLFWYIA